MKRGNGMDSFNDILKKLPKVISYELLLLPQNIIVNLEEIRLRCGFRTILQYNNTEKQLTKVISKEDLEDALNSIIKFSYYAYEEDLAKGFITISGGHRVGICGKAVVNNGQPILIKEISSMNIRFAKEIKGCANSLLPYILNKDKVKNTLIVSPPGCGKTTILRDITRIISNRGVKVAICDERSEIAGIHQCHPSYDLGPRTDVLDGCDKTYGIPMLIRSMSPEVIITDEIGKSKDIETMELCQNSGVKLITSIHGSSIDDLMNSKIEPLIKKKLFENIIFLSKDNGPGTIKEIICD